jgi:hypothetical protein
MTNLYQAGVDAIVEIDSEIASAYGSTDGGTEAPAVEEPADVFPASAIGRLDFGEGAFCTGSMVGPAMVLTAAHCFYDEEGLIRWLGKQGSLAKVRPDQKIVLIRDWDDADSRLKGTAGVLGTLAGLAAEVEKAAA